MLRASFLFYRLHLHGCGDHRPGKLLYRSARRHWTGMRVGMNLSELNKALDTSFKKPTDPDEQGCTYVEVPRRSGIGVMILDGRVARVDVQVTHPHGRLRESVMAIRKRVPCRCMGKGSRLSQVFITRRTVTILPFALRIGNMGSGSRATMARSLASTQGLPMQSLLLRDATRQVSIPGGSPPIGK